MTHLIKEYITRDPWKIIEDQFYPQHNRITESLCSLGNGAMGQRANFEEQYSGDTFQGSYIAGIYFPDKTKVGWWKNGYPKYFAKVLNSPNWIGINLLIDGEPLDLATCEVKQFTRVLNMKEGVLTRSFTAVLPSKKAVEVHVTRFLSITHSEIGAIRYVVKPLNFEGQLTITPYIDGDIENEDSNYRMKFWAALDQSVDGQEGYVAVKTKKLDFHVCVGMKFDVLQSEKKLSLNPVPTEKRKYIASTVTVTCKKNQETIIEKYAAITSSLNHEKSALRAACKKALHAVYSLGFEKLLQEQIAAWDKKWQESDIIIEGDIAAQQGIRFNIFQLNQTYTGEDERLNIGPKGFTGEKYGGSTYWDTEAYCIPFYLSTANEKVARNLLLYRYKQLDRAIENAKKLGFHSGAALYPMVTMNGEECHNEWEITFEEIHRNGAIAYAIFNYARYTGDQTYLADYGLEVLIGISRFWAQRVNWSIAKNQYVMLGVTGPNEYENNVNNNWYTNTIACWTMEYTIKSLSDIQKSH
ncbi:MAG: maltose phosphorylase, partial [Gammaproteobacteria bacterium GWF2_41_13]